MTGQADDASLPDCWKSGDAEVSCTVSSLMTIGRRLTSGAARLAAISRQP